MDLRTGQGRPGEGPLSEGPGKGPFAGPPGRDWPESWIKAASAPLVRRSGSPVRPARARGTGRRGRPRGRQPPSFGEGTLVGRRGPISFEGTPDLSAGPDADEQVIVVGQHLVEEIEL